MTNDWILPTTCVSVFDHFVRLALKGLIYTHTYMCVSGGRKSKFFWKIFVCTKWMFLFQISSKLVLFFIGNDSVLWHALLFLEEAVECSQTFAQFKLLLMYIYANLGKLSVFIFTRRYTLEIDLLSFFHFHSEPFKEWKL